MSDTRKVLCMASAYEQKYYFNEEFAKLPQNIKDEVQILSVLFTEEVGGEFSIVFEEDGTGAWETNAEESDFYYDEISSGLMVKEVARKREELLESLSLFYRVFIKKENIADIDI